MASCVPGELIPWAFVWLSIPELPHVAKAGDFSCKWGGLICWNGPHHAPFEGVGITDWC